MGFDDDPDADRPLAAQLAALRAEVDALEHKLVLLWTEVETHRAAIARLERRAPPPDA